MPNHSSLSLVARMSGSDMWDHRSGVSNLPHIAFAHAGYGCSQQRHPEAAERSEGLEGFLQLRVPRWRCKCSASTSAAMIRFVLRSTGFFVLAAAFVALLYDGTKTIAGEQVHLTALQQVWTHVHAASLVWLEAMVERHAGGWVWESIFASVLGAPAALVLAILGAMLMLLGRRKKPTIGYAR